MKRTDSTDILHVPLESLSEEALREGLAHCASMMFSTSGSHPGRLVLAAWADESAMRCKAELVMRYLEKEKRYSRAACCEDIREIAARNPDAPLSGNGVPALPVGFVMDGLPDGWADVPLRLMLLASMRSLGRFENRKISLSFLTSLGLAMDEKTRLELQRAYPGKKTAEAANAFLGLPESTVLHFHYGLLTLEEMRSVLKTGRKPYGSMNDTCLSALGCKVLPRYSLLCHAQASEWERKADEISRLIKKARMFEN